MKILAADFSSERRSVALLDSRRVAESGGVCRAEDEGPARRGGLMLVERLLAEARVAREEIDCLAVGLGPGSYTGIRSAISLAQGWQLARSVRLLGISSVECLAAQLQGEGLSGRVQIVIDAQRGEFYLATYEVSEGGPRLVEPLRLAALAEVAGRQAAGERVVGPEVERWFPGGTRLEPDAGVLARLALGRTDFVAGETLEPIYLRETSFVKARPPTPKWRTEA